MMYHLLQKVLAESYVMVSGLVGVPVCIQTSSSVAERLLAAQEDFCLSLPMEMMTPAIKA